jgi:hypothetical protein
MGKPRSPKSGSSVGRKKLLWYALLNGLLKTSCAVNEADEMEEGMIGASMPGVSPEKSHVAFGPAAAAASASVTVAFTKG